MQNLINLLRGKKEEEQLYTPISDENMSVMESPNFEQAEDQPIMSEMSPEQQAALSELQVQPDPSSPPAAIQNKNTVINSGNSASNSNTNPPTSDTSSPLSKSEQLMQQYIALQQSSQKELEDARNRDRMLKIGGSIGDALATYINAAGQKRVKAPGVQVQQGAGLSKVADMFATAPDKASDMKQRREDLLAQYKALSEGDSRALQERRIAAYEKQVNSLDKARNEKAPDIGFKEKEEIKAKVKEDVQVAKENRDLKKQLEPAIANIDDQIKNVKDALNLINKSKVVGTGPLDQYFAGATPEGQLLKKALGNISLDTLVQKFQGMSRAIDTETDRKFFQETQPSMGNFETTNKKMLGDILTRLESVKKRSQDKLKEIETQKAPAATQTSNLVRIKGPSGEEATMTEDKAQKYLSRPGYTRLE
jgi:hypothetical protein